MPDQLGRRAAREQAFALLFELSFHPGESLRDILDTRGAGSPAGLSAGVQDDTPAPDDFARALALRAEEHLKRLDEEIARRLKPGWRLGRIPRATHALLRLAVCEMRYFDDIPVGASINEAVELAKIYADDEAPRFINGVLGAIAREPEPNDTGD